MFLKISPLVLKVPIIYIIYQTKFKIIISNVSFKTIGFGYFPVFDIFL